MLRAVSAFAIVVGVGLVLVGAGYYGYLRFTGDGLAILNAGSEAVQACLVVLCGIASILVGFAVGTLTLLEEIKGKLAGGATVSKTDV